MPTSRSLSTSAPQKSQPKPLRERVSGAFEKLTAAAAELNTASDELAKPISAIETVLQGLNPGVPAWTVFRSYLNGDFGEHGETRYCLGYAKVSRKWGLAISRTVVDLDGMPLTDEEWHFNDAPRRYRVQALEKLPELLEDMAKTAGKTATELREKTTLAQQVADTISQMVPSKPARRKAGHHG